MEYYATENAIRNRFSKRHKFEYIKSNLEHLPDYVIALTENITLENGDVIYIGGLFGQPVDKLIVHIE